MPWRIGLVLTAFSGIAVAVAAIDSSVQPKDAVAASSQGPPLKAPIGEFCRVQLRRDAIGAENAAGSLTAGSINGAIIGIGGRLCHFDQEWLVLENAEEFLWIPRGSVLLLRQSKTRDSAPQETPANDDGRQKTEHKHEYD